MRATAQTDAEAVKQESMLSDIERKQKSLKALEGAKAQESRAFKQKHYLIKTRDGQEIRCTPNRLDAYTKHYGKDVIKVTEIKRQYKKQKG